MLSEKEKYLAEIETRLVKFNDTYNEIKSLAERRNVDPAQLKMDRIPWKTEQAREQAKQLQEEQENAWQSFKSGLDNLLDDIDKDLRGALAYFG